MRISSASAAQRASSSPNAGGAVDVAGVITHHFDIDHTADALTLAARDPNSLKSIVRLS